MLTATGGLYHNGHGRARRNGNFDHGNPRNNFDEMMAKLETLEFQNKSLTMQLHGHQNASKLSMMSRGFPDIDNGGPSLTEAQHDVQKLIIKARGVAEKPMYRHRMATSPKY